ncbi:MAG TPA: carboxypeptidase-like regulatory domain-containing protein [Bacillota bacterium]|nr:carboxypeptidase-like regulatory domain-containing protein [Bacillota bacterium]
MYMKKYLPILLMIITLSFSGCFSGKETIPATGFSGQVLDQNGNPVAGMVMEVTGKSSQPTDSSGRFVIAGVADGSWKLTGAGGAVASYRLGPVTVSVADGKIVGSSTYTAYRIKESG